MPKNITAELTDEMKAAIDNYSDSIKTIEDHVKAVRMMPGNFGGSTTNSGFLDMIREIFQNAIDQVLSDKSPANWCSIRYDMRDYSTIVWDNGTGLPFQDMIRIYTAPNTSKNYYKNKGEYSSGRHGSGGKTVNALSSEFIAESYRYDGTAARLVTDHGYPTTKEPVPIKNKDKFQGTMVKFTPDLEIMDDGLYLDWHTVFNLVRRILFRTPIGSVCDFEGIDLDGVSHKERIVNKDGIIGDLIEKTTSPLYKPIIGFKDTGEMKLEFAFTFDGGGKDGPSSQEEIIAFCNFCPCFIGTHVDGTVNGITRWFTKYMNSIYLKSNTNPKSKKQISCQASDIKTGLVVSISAAMLFPNFIGQNKEKLSNTEMIQFCSDVVYNALEDWSKTNPQDLAKLCKYFKDVAELRMKESSEKAKIVSKYTANVFGMPSKYRKPSKQKKEFIIVEGDSAANSVYNGRDAQTQGYFPIRGKMPNAFRTPRNKFLENEEVQGIIKIIMNKDPRDVPKKGPIPFDAEKDVPWEKIILMADADVDELSSKDAFRVITRVMYIMANGKS